MLKTGVTVLGALFSALGTTGAFIALGADWRVLLIIVAACAGLALISYIVAAVSAITTFGEFMRGWLIGLNGALNGVVAFAIVASFGGIAAGAVVGGALGVVNLLSVFPAVSQSGFYQGLLGWFNWIMPMSWIIVALGLFFLVISFLLHLVTAGKVAYLRIEDAGVDWATGTFFIKGGLIANLNYLDTAFNMGNFSFVDYKSTSWHKEHEAGHTLNLAAFGWLFHLVGALDENVLRGANAYAERLAESNATGKSGSNIPMWS